MRNREPMWPDQRARTAGVVYLLYLAAVGLAWNLVGWWPAACRGALLAANLFYLALAVLLYGLFKPVGRRVALEAMLFGAAGSVLGILHVLHLAGEIRTIPFLAGFLLLTGWLVVRSKFLPQFLGWLLLLAGAGWLAYLAPAVAGQTHGRMSDFSFAVEGMLALWLLVKGVNVPRWNERAGAAEAAGVLEG